MNKTNSRLAELTGQISLQATIEENYRRFKPVFLLFGIIISVYLGLSLLSFRPEDLIDIETDNGNIGGVLGAKAAGNLLHHLGYGAWCVLPVGGMFAWKLAGRQIGGFWRMLGWTGILWAVMCVCCLITPDLTTGNFYAGGTIGSASVAAMTWLIGPGGAWLFLFAWTLSLCLLVTGLDLKDFTNRWILHIENVGPSVGQRSIDFGSDLLNQFRHMGQGIAARFKRDEKWEDEEDWYEDGFSYTDDGLLLDDVNSLPPSSPFADEDQSFIEESYFGEFSYEDEASDDGAFDDLGDRTKVQQNELVEVEWDPTVASEPGIANEIAVQTRRKNKRKRRPKRDLDGLRPTANDEPVARPRMESFPTQPPKINRKASEEEQRDLAHSIWEEDLSKWYQPSVSDASEEESAFEDYSQEEESVFSEELEFPQMPKKRKQALPELSADVNPVDERSEAFSQDDDSSGKIQLPSPPVAKRSSNVSGVHSITPSKKVKVEPGNLQSGGRIRNKKTTKKTTTFELPSLSLLDKHPKCHASFDEEELQSLAIVLEEKLAEYKVTGEVVEIRPGPVITTFEFKPGEGIRVSKIASLSDDIAMALKAVRVRIVAPIPGKDVVGIEIPNKKRQIIWSVDIFASSKFQKSTAKLPLGLGKTVEGLPYMSDLAKMPHLLVGGTTGSGKSVGINSMLLSILFKHSPETLKLILIDPKMLEFEMYHDIPHLIHPVVTDSHLANGILKWACDEMDRRYKLMAKFKTRTIDSFNQRLEVELEDWNDEKAVKFAPLDWNGESIPPKPTKMPFLVIVIDELADLMMVAGKEVESSIIRLAQKARACGIHLIVATQRPSVDVITGMIKANMPCRVAFQVRQRTDGRTILDQNGAENLLGKGDMLFLPPGVSSLQRCHGPFVTDDEVRRVTDFLRAQGAPSYEVNIKAEKGGAAGVESNEEYDEFYDQAVDFVAKQGRASTSMLQRQFKIGYNRAARMIDIMESEGIIGPQEGAKRRKVLIEPPE